MNLGLAIFLSSLFLGVIFLFHSTKDRWNWKKIIKFTSIVLLSLSIIFSAYYIFFLSSNTISYHKPIKATEFWEIKLGDSKEYVKFLKGNPNEIDSLKSVWIYTKKHYYRVEYYYKVVFNNGIVTSIVYMGNSYALNLLGRYFIGYNLQSIKDYLGEPTDVSSTNDGLKRVYSFSTYNVVFYLKKNKVFAFGIYNPSYGTYKY